MHPFLLTNQGGGVTPPNKLYTYCALLLSAAAEEDHADHSNQQPRYFVRTAAAAADHDIYTDHSKKAADHVLHISLGCSTAAGFWCNSQAWRPAPPHIAGVCQAPFFCQSPKVKGGDPNAPPPWVIYFHS